MQKFLIIVISLLSSLSLFANDDIDFGADAKSVNCKSLETDSVATEVTKTIPVSLTTTVYSDADMEARRNIDGEQPVMPANIQIGTSKLTLFGYAQTGYTYKHTNKENANAFDITRIIFMANAELTKQLSFFIMYDAAASKLHEYYGQYAFSPALKVRVGQFKQPYTLENIYPPTILDNISFNNSVLYMTGIATDPALGATVARDAGVMITGDLLPKDGRPQFNYQLGVFNGTGMNIKENNNQKSVIGMLNYMPTSSLLFSGSFALGTSKAANGKFINNEGVAQIPTGANYHRNRYALGAELKTKPVYFRSEYMWGKDASVNLQGFYTDFEYHVVPKKFDLVADFDYIDTGNYRDSRGITRTVTLGAQYWLYKQCRILSQFVHTDPKKGAISNAWITQFQIAF